MNHTYSKSIQTKSVVFVCNFYDNHVSATSISLNMTREICKHFETIAFLQLHCGALLTQHLTLLDITKKLMNHF